MSNRFLLTDALSDSTDSDTGESKDPGAELVLIAVLSNRTAGPATRGTKTSSGAHGALK